MSSLHDSLNFSQTSVSAALKDDVQSKEEVKMEDKVEITQEEEPTTKATQQDLPRVEEKKEELTPVVDKRPAKEELQKREQAEGIEEAAAPTTVQDTQVNPDEPMKEAKTLEWKSYPQQLLQIKKMLQSQ